MPRKYLVVLSFLFVVLLAGCRKPSGGTGPTSAGTSARPAQDNLQQALDYLSRLEEFDPDKSMLKMAYHLNRWIEDSQIETSWQEDPLLEQLPSQLRRIAPLTQLRQRHFLIEDMKFLREISWMRSVSQWVSRQPLPQDLKPWLEQLEKTKGEPHAFEVGMAYRLFDWTVRNVQLEELLPYPTAAAGPAAPGKAEATTSKPPPEQAIPGPGYTAFPWQALMYGRGDAWQRARVCIALARQQHLDVVMLSFDDPLAAPRPRPWLSAALVDDQLYLFDPGLGLPIPGPGGVGIATLQQVREDKGLLTGLEMGEKLRYAGAGADLDRLVALIDAAPEFLSRRMKLIESHLRSGQGLVLSQEPTALKERLKKCPGVSQVALWKTPLETWVFRAAFERRAEHDPELRRIRMTREDLYEGLHPLARARQLHLRGAFENQHDKEGAKAMYLKARLPDSMIAELETSVEIQQAVGLVRGRENDEEWRNRLQNQKLLAQHVKRNASYWLGLVHYDTARYAAAVDWLKNRTLDASDGSPWAAGARYNLARTYEAQGQFQAARDMLLLDKSPQKHGNLLRARQLRKQLESEGEPAAKRTEK